MYINQIKHNIGYRILTYIKAQFLDDPCILSGSQFGKVLTFSAGADHLSRPKYEGCGSGLTDTHDDGSKTLWVVFGIPGVESDLLQI